MRILLLLLHTATALAFSGLTLRQLPATSRLQRLARASAQAENDDDACLVDEPEVECNLRKTVDGPWADAWAKYVLLRPGMSFSELKAATLQRNQLDPRMRIPGTARTIVLTHALCFIIAIPALLQSTLSNFSHARQLATLTASLCISLSFCVSACTCVHTDDAVLPKLVEAAAVSRVSSGIP